MWFAVFWRISVRFLDPPVTPPPFQAFHTGKVVMTLMNIICLGKLMCGGLSVPPTSLNRRLRSPVFSTSERSGPHGKRELSSDICGHAQRLFLCS